MKQAHASERGAIGLPLEGGGEEMIDAPMIKQVRARHISATFFLSLDVGIPITRLKALFVLPKPQA